MVERSEIDTTRMTIVRANQSDGWFVAVAMVLVCAICVFAAYMALTGQAEDTRLSLAAFLTPVAIPAAAFYVMRARRSNEAVVVLTEQSLEHRWALSRPVKWTEITGVAKPKPFGADRHALTLDVIRGCDVEDANNLILKIARWPHRVVNGTRLMLPARALRLTRDNLFTYIDA